MSTNDTCKVQLFSSQKALLMYPLLRNLVRITSVETGIYQETMTRDPGNQSEEIPKMLLRGTFQNKYHSLDRRMGIEGHGAENSSKQPDCGFGHTEDPHTYEIHSVCQ